MPGRTAPEAANFFHQHFAESLSVITDAYLKALRVDDNYLLLYDPLPRVETTHGGVLYLDILQTFVTSATADGGFRAHTTSYQYVVMENNTESNDHGVVSYHWHPDRTTKLRWPHLHVVPRDQDAYVGPRVHLPTARVSIEDFVFLLIRDFHVRPRFAYAEWKKILTTNKTSFVTYAHWWAYAMNQPLISN